MLENKPYCPIIYSFCFLLLRHAKSAEKLMRNTDAEELSGCGGAQRSTRVMLTLCARNQTIRAHAFLLPCNNTQDKTDSTAAHNTRLSSYVSPDLQRSVFHQHNAHQTAKNNHWQSCARWLHKVLPKCGNTVQPGVKYMGASAYLVGDGLHFSGFSFPALSPTHVYTSPQGSSQKHNIICCTQFPLLPPLNIRVNNSISLSALFQVDKPISEMNLKTLGWERKSWPCHRMISNQKKFSPLSCIEGVNITIRTPSGKKGISSHAPNSP